MSAPILFPVRTELRGGGAGPRQPDPSEPPRLAQVKPLLRPRPSTRAERSELVALLVGAVVLLAEVKDPVGRVYRENVLAGIRSIIARERPL